MITKILQRSLLVACFAAPLSVTQADSYTVDPAHTYPGFKINHLGFSVMQGKFDKTTGTMEYNPGAGTASVNLVIDASSIDTGHDKRDKHLRSPDFLNTAEYPDITFKSTSVKFDGDQLKQVTGDLTITGVTNSVSLAVTRIHCGANPFNKKPTCGFNATASINRSDFNVKYGLPAIGDSMDLSFEIEGVKN